MRYESMLRKTVALWSYETLRAIIDEWDTFEQEGEIGDDSILWHVATVELAASGSPTYGMSRMMEDITFEVFRRLAFEKLSQEPWTSVKTGASCNTVFQTSYSSEDVNTCWKSTVKPPEDYGDANST
jgi:hypothetical protein